MLVRPVSSDDVVVLRRSPLRCVTSVIVVFGLTSGLAIFALATPYSGWRATDWLWWIGFLTFGCAVITRLLGEVVGTFRSRRLTADAAGITLDDPRLLKSPVSCPAAAITRVSVDANSLPTGPTFMCRWIFALDLPLVITLSTPVTAHARRSWRGLSMLTPWGTRLLVHTTTTDSLAIPVHRRDRGPVIELLSPFVNVESTVDGND